MIKTRGVFHGKAFESLIAFQARLQGMLLVSHGSKARRVSATQMIALKSDVDFRLGSPDGELVFFDAKSFQGSHYTYGMLTPHQLQRCAMYAQFKQRAGMLVLLRDVDAVVYHPISLIMKRGKGGRFTKDDGIYLGSRIKFSYAPLFTSVA